MRAVGALISIALAMAAAAADHKELLHIPVWVRTGNTDGTPAGIKATVGGSTVQPKKLLGPKDDLVLIVVTDLTGDITLAGTAKRALGERIEKRPANAAVGLLRAQDGLRALVDATVDREPVKTAVETLPVSGKAGLLEAIPAAGALGDAILAKADVRVAVLFLTDSDVYNYREDFTNPTINWSDSNDISRRFRDGLVRERISKLDAALAGVETPMFIVHLFYTTDALNQAYQTGLSTLAATTGGASYFCRTQAEISDTISRVFDAIGSHFSLRVPVEATGPDVVNIGLESPGRTLSWRARASVRK